MRSLCSVEAVEIEEVELGMEQGESVCTQILIYGLHANT